MRKAILGVLMFVGAVACWGHVDDEGELPAPICDVGELRCDGRILQLCTDDGASWAPLELCASPELCDPAAFGCQEPVCAEGETRCVGYQRQRCSANRSSWEVIEWCTSAATCDPAGCQ